MKFTLLATGLAALTLLLSPVANATPEQDETFFDTLYGLNIEPGPNAVAAAHMTCSYLELGYSPSALAYELWLSNDLDPQGARNFIDAAAAIYCPTSYPQIVA